MNANVYDYIVVGAGSAGCVLANRLSADPKNRVLLIEAGGRDSWIWYHIPVGFFFTIGNPRSDWCFKTLPEAGLGGRRVNFPRGKVIGGSSAINAMIYMRGQSADYDRWERMGLDGWGWKDVFPVFQSHVRQQSSGLRSGELHVETPRVRWDILDAIRDASEGVGIVKIDDFNTGDNSGSSYFQVTQKRGRRWSAASAFLKPVMSRPNLTVMLHTLVERISFTGEQARELICSCEGKEFAIPVGREIVLCAGAVATPGILERSGVGSPDRLVARDIKPVHCLRGVGENLQDHLQLRPMFRIEGTRTLNMDYQSPFRRALMGLDYAIRRRGPLSMASSQVGAFVRSSDRHETPNLQFHFQPLSLPGWGQPLHEFHAFTASVCNLRPTSRGSIHVTGKSALDEPAIQANYLSTDEDRQVAIESLRLARAIAQQPALARYKPTEFAPGTEYQTDGELLDAAAGMATTIFHPVGTARMGLRSDPLAVVDSRLKLIGLEGVRIADASVMPSIISGNTNAASMMIGEKAASYILADQRADRTRIEASRIVMV